MMETPKTKTMTNESPIKKELLGPAIEAIVGDNEITEIEAYQEIDGTIWFKIWCDTVMIARINSKHVSAVRY